MTDEASIAIAADRFANLPPGCPDIIDSLAATLVLSNGVSVQGGAQNMPAVVAQWKTWLGKADYVLLSPDTASQAAHPVDGGAVGLVQRGHSSRTAAYSPATGQLYRRVDYTPPGQLSGLALPPASAVAAHRPPAQPLAATPAASPTVRSASACSVARHDPSASPAR